MKHTDAGIQFLKERLVQKALNDRTPKKYAGDMFEAAEVIQQLQAEVRRIAMKLDIYQTAFRLYGKGWRADDRDELIADHGYTDAEIEAICTALAEITEYAE